MPTTLGIPYRPDWMGVPPHMYGEDMEIWNAYRLQILREARNLYFDVGLGGQTEVPPGTSPELARMWLRNTQKRVDIVIETHKEWILVELRAHASASAVGRLLQYRALWMDDPPDQKPIKLRIITDWEDSDMKRLCEALDIEYIVVEI